MAEESFSYSVIWKIGTGVGAAVAAAWPVFWGWLRKKLRKLEKENEELRQKGDCVLLGHRGDPLFSKKIVECLTRMNEMGVREGLTVEVCIALDFCSFGAFGNPTAFEEQAKLIEGIAKCAHAKHAPVTVIANTLAVCESQLEKYFSTDRWSACHGQWIANIAALFQSPRFLKHVFQLINELEINSEHPEWITRTDWIKLRLAFETGVRKDYRTAGAELREAPFPGVAPFHAWLCKPPATSHSAYGVMTLCTHHTAASDELGFEVKNAVADEILGMVRGFSV